MSEPKRWTILLCVRCSKTLDGRDSCQCESDDFPEHAIHDRHQPDDSATYRDVEVVSAAEYDRVVEETERWRCRAMELAGVIENIRAGVDAFDERIVGPLSRYRAALVEKDVLLSCSAGDKPAVPSQARSRSR